MDDQKLNDLQSTYDRVAAEYARRIYGELPGKPLDRALLDRLAAQLQGQGIICDMGCGPGHVARYLHDRGAHVIGIDLAPGMLEQARRLNPQIEFRQGNMLALTDVADAAWTGIVIFYALIHVPRDEVVAALRELRRTLQPNGPLLLAFHVGDEVLHLDTWWEQPAAADFVFFRPSEMTDYLRQAGFEIVEIVERPPYPDVEHQSQRAYVWARRPA
jgi:SAM-dependent methyltransferase